MRRVLLALWLPLALLSATSPVAAKEPRAVVGEEPLVLRFRWRLEGLQGVLARLLGVVPTAGDGVMTLSSDAEGRLEVRFTATSEKAGEADHWTYETLVDADEWRTLRVRETYRFRKKRREKDFELLDRQVIDVLSGLQQLRYELPSSKTHSTLWSGGKTYPVMVTPKGTEVRVIGEREVPLRRFEIRGFRTPGERYWSARAEVWLSTDDEALPMEMVYRQSLGRLRLTLVESD